MSLGLLGLINNGRQGFNAFQNRQGQPMPGQEAIAQTQAAEQAQASDMINSIVNGQQTSNQFPQQGHANQGYQRNSDPTTFVGPGGVPVDYTPAGYQMDGMVLPERGGVDMNFDPQFGSPFVQPTSFNGGQQQQQQQPNGQMPQQPQDGVLKALPVDDPTGQGSGKFMNLTGSMQDPNAFLRMSQGYTSGGLLGALGMLLTKNQQ